MKQYMPKKPVKCGFKVWMLADAHTGYVSGFEVYTGKKVTLLEQDLEPELSKHCASPYNTGIEVK